MRNFDVFGKEVLLKYKGQTYNQTALGGLLTIGILVVVILRLNYLIDQINTQQNPQVYQYERQSSQSQSFLITPQNFTFVIGITSDGQNYQQINSQIFNIKSFITIQSTKQNSGSQTPQVNTQQYQVNLQKCTYSDFQIDGVQLDSSKYSNQYCISSNQPIQISGDYTAQNFATLTIQLQKCTGSGCADEQTIQNFIKTNFVEVFISDILVQPSVGSNPFSYYGRLFRVANLYSQTKVANIYFRNNQVDTDKGFLFSSISSKSNPSFSYYDEQVFDFTSDYITSIVLKYEQKKENYYSLSYQKFIGVICELGALIYVLSLVCSPICSFCAKADLCVDLINQCFSFQEIKPSIKTSNDKYKTTNAANNNNNNQNLAELVSEDKESNNKIPVMSVFANIPKKESLRINSLNENKVKSILKQKETQVQSSQPSAESMHSSSDKNEELKQLLEQIREYNQAKEQLEKKKPLIKGSKEQKQKLMESIKAKQLRDNIKKTQIKISEVLKKQNNSFKCNFTEYVKSYFFTNPKTKIIDKTVKQLNQNLDVQMIMSKLTEIDYLKKILLNEDQQALFQFLPKANLNYSIVQNEVIFHNSSSGEKSMPEYYQEEYEKLKRGIDSYKNLMNQDQLQMVDNNLLKIIDPSYMSLFKDLCDRKKSVTITAAPTPPEQLRNGPSILIHKVSSQHLLLNPQKKPNKKMLNSPQFSSQQEQPQIVIFQQQQQSLCLPENMLTRQIEVVQSKRQSISTPQNTTAQLAFPSQIENDFSHDFISQVDQEANSNHNYLHSILEENLKYHSTSGIIQKPYLTNEPDVTLKNNQ
ncbi:transmembrane protein, putative (macronuclear) [Tetrahymena thermophila SB210]|uniref:Transmembrane protein, putative n=1 Tax=Tetrahymena thermophila (strain SB210) TaxID=312017 RepID=Q235R7_TETTS|nr:transmembrane protein, putative [Tetrahymena thermophila SB210]EAR92289.2 transmembrane protein, putative [Tetrahymena thermophila SB210]|eukprot:XP_001012534.2 transmembrane protein, putative [Tetrahymena thermophila SB210]